MPLGQIYWVLALQVCPCVCVCVCEGTVLAGRLPAGVGWEDEREPRRAHSRWACSVRVWQPCLPLPPQAYLRGGCLLVCALEQIVGYLGLAYYLDSVLPDSYGVCRPPWFLLQPGYWSRQKVRALGSSEDVLPACRQQHAQRQRMCWHTNCTRCSRCNPPRHPRWRLPPFPLCAEAQRAQRSARPGGSHRAAGGRGGRS